MSAVRRRDDGADRGEAGATGQPGLGGQQRARGEDRASGGQLVGRGWGGGRARCRAGSGPRAGAAGRRHEDAGAGGECPDQDRPASGGSALPVTVRHDPDPATIGAPIVTAEVSAWSGPTRAGG
jgi:hypothetical protein